MRHWSMTALEMILWPIVFVAKLIWTVVKWTVYAILEFFSWVDG